MKTALNPANQANIAPKTAIVCRQIRVDDIDAVVRLLARGFPERPLDYWRVAMSRLRDRETPEGYPRFGYGLFNRDMMVGVLLLIVSRGDDNKLRGNLSSWCVEPEFRGYSVLLQAAPFRLKDLTLFNISPAPNTIRTIEASGFRRYSTGVFLAVAGIGGKTPDAVARRMSVELVRSNVRVARLVDGGCLAFEVDWRGERIPFAFLPRRALGGWAPCAHLAYCRSLDDFVAVARPLGRALLKAGYPLIAVDATGPIAGLVGRFAHGQPKMYRGMNPPRLGDLSDSEIALFGA